MSSLNNRILQALAESQQQIKPINQASLSRVLNHMKKKAFCLITAFRGNLTREENLKRNKELAKYIINSHWGFFRVNGKFVQSDHEDGKKIFAQEDSYFVVGPELNNEEAVEDFKSNMIMLGRKFDQQSIILGTEDGVFEVDKVGKKLTKFKNSPDIVTNKDAENFMTQLISRGNRAFKLSAISTIEDNLKHE